MWCQITLGLLLAGQRWVLVELIGAVHERVWPTHVSDPSTEIDLPTYLTLHVQEGNLESFDGALIRHRQTTVEVSPNHHRQRCVRLGFEEVAQCLAHGKPHQPELFAKPFGHWKWNMVQVIYKTKAFKGMRVWIPYLQNKNIAAMRNEEKYCLEVITLNVKVTPSKQNIHDDLRVVLPAFGAPRIASRIGTTGFGAGWHRKCIGSCVNCSRACLLDMKYMWPR